MPLPFFYKEDIDITASTIVLDEPTSKHIVQVLRMQNGEQLQITNGKGNLFTCAITDNNKKKCIVTIIKTSEIANLKSKITIAISLLKNLTRFEWFLEKSTEIGVTQIIPLICQRTEKTTFKFERLNNILISAMLQSQQCWLPKLIQPKQFSHVAIEQFNATNKFIAHCLDEENKQMLIHQLSTINHQLICIGPEGDFTKQEIEIALQNNFMAVSLGNTRLRTETAGIVAATILANF